MCCRRGRSSPFARLKVLCCRNEQQRRRVVRPWRGERCRVAMDILAVMFAYLASVAGIVAALAISFVLYFSPPHHATPVKQTVAMVVQQSGPKAAPPPQRASA